MSGSCETGCQFLGGDHYCVTCGRKSSYLIEAEEILRHLHGYRPDATDAPAKAFDHDRHLLASKLQALPPRHPEPAEPQGFTLAEDMKFIEPVIVPPPLVELIKWRDRAALDWWGEELVFHVASALKRMRTESIPPEHQAAHSLFLAMEEDLQIEAVGAVLGWE